MLYSIVVVVDVVVVIQHALHLKCTFTKVYAVQYCCCCCCCYTACCAPKMHVYCCYTGCPQGWTFSALTCSCYKFIYLRFSWLGAQVRHEVGIQSLGTGLLIAGNSYYIHFTKNVR